MKRLTPDEENKFLKQKLANEKKINAALQEEIELLHFEIERLRRNAGIEKVLGSFQSKAFAAAAADLLLDPAPMELLCSGEKADTSETYLVRLSDVLAIHSRKRPKDIFLKKAIRPRSGGREQVKITFDKNDINFDELLTAIQRGSNYLLRVHNSFAVHIFHYVFSKKKSLYCMSSYKLMKTGTCMRYRLIRSLTRSCIIPVFLKLINYFSINLPIN